MKGMVFTEFLEMVEDQFGLDMVDDLIESTRPSSGGSYTSVGTYPFSELESMLKALCERSGQSVPDLLEAFGLRLFDRLAAGHPGIIKDFSDPLAFMESIEQYIHIEVRKLYPDADLPTFKTGRPDPDSLRLEYQSSRPMADFAAGLIKGCLTHFNTNAKVTRTHITDGHEVFLIERHD